MTRITVPKTVRIPLANSHYNSIEMDPTHFAIAVEEIMKSVPGEVFDTISLKIRPIIDKESRYDRDHIWHGATVVEISITRDMTTEEKEAEREIELAKIRFTDLTKKTEEPVVVLSPSTPKPSFFNPSSWTGRK